jgi:hypothetical protein
MRANVIIEGVLRDHPDSRSSDKELYILVWEQFGFFMSESQKAKFRELPSSETIRRVRQKLQEEGKYTAAERVRRHRNRKSQEVQQRMPTTKSDKVEPLLEAIDNGDMAEASAAAKRIIGDIPRFQTQ